MLSFWDGSCTISVWESSDPVTMVTGMILEEWAGATCRETRQQRTSPSSKITAACSMGRVVPGLFSAIVLHLLQVITSSDSNHFKVRQLRSQASLFVSHRTKAKLGKDRKNSSCAKTWDTLIPSPSLCCLQKPRTQAGEEPGYKASLQYSREKQGGRRQRLLTEHSVEMCQSF